jgi:hypothetical protein
MLGGTFTYFFFDPLDVTAAQALHFAAQLEVTADFLKNQYLSQSVFHADHLFS